LPVTRKLLQGCWESLRLCLANSTGSTWTEGWWWSPTIYHGAAERRYSCR